MEKATILVVDDTPENVRLLISILQEQGSTVLAALNGPRALGIARTEQPDLILLDIMMPDMNGYQVCEQLKSDERTRNIPIIFLSALHDVTDKVKGFSMGGVDFITKPFQPEEVLARIQTHISLRNLQKHLEEQNARLQQEIRERQHAETALQQRTVELEVVNKELKNFAQIVSHDLKAPLRGINQLVTWLVQDYAGAFDEKGRETVDLLLGRVKCLDALIQGILQYSRAGRLGGTPEPIDLNELVQNVISLLAPPKHIDVRVENRLPTLNINRTCIQQLFQNLLSNALKYMDKPSGTVTVGCVEEPVCWTFRITDNGPGIAPQHHERIFQLFQTVDARDDSEVSGIGLAIVKKIVESYKGRIWLESEPGAGSTFFFSIPREGK